MKSEKDSDVSPEFEIIMNEKIGEHYILKLFVTGSTLKSVQAINNIKRFCEENLKNHYDLQIIDLYQQPELARKEQIYAAPTLLKIEPLPLRRIIGDFSDSMSLMSRLDILK